MLRVDLRFPLPDYLRPTDELIDSGLSRASEFTPEAPTAVGKEREAERSLGAKQATVSPF